MYYFLLGRKFKSLARKMADSHHPRVLIVDIETIFNIEFVGMITCTPNFRGLIEWIHYLPLSNLRPNVDFIQLPFSCLTFYTKLE
jgi:hypothetical protein